MSRGVREGGIHVGAVVATGPDGSHTATAGADGRYTLQLLPGTYTMTGTSPPGGNGTCSADRKVSVGPNEKFKADVYCVVP